VLDDALFGSDERGVYVVRVESETKGMALVVPKTGAATVIDVELRDATWRAPKGLDWALIGGAIGGGVGGLLLIALLVYLLTRKGRAEPPGG
jgi:hypothetical protein